MGRDSSEGFEAFTPALILWVGVLSGQGREEIYERYISKHVLTRQGLMREG